MEQHMTHIMNWVHSELLLTPLQAQQNIFSLIFKPLKRADSVRSFEAELDTSGSELSALIPPLPLFPRPLPPFHSLRREK